MLEKGDERRRQPPFTENELSIVEQVIGGYIEVLSDSLSLHRLQFRAQLILLRVRLSLGESTFALGDLELMAEALRGFARLTQQTLPQSGVRDEVLETMRRLRKMLEDLIDEVIGPGN